MRVPLHVCYNIGMMYRYTGDIQVEHPGPQLLRAWELGTIVVVVKVLGSIGIFSKWSQNANPKPYNSERGLVGWGNPKP